MSVSTTTSSNDAMAIGSDGDGSVLSWNGSDGDGEEDDSVMMPDDDRSSSSDEQDEDEATPTRHNNVWCDECGANPIVGIRYKSTQQNNYDICQECLDENHASAAADAFVAFGTPVMDEDQAEGEVTQGGIGLSFHSLQQLSTSPQLIDANSAVDDVTLYLHSFDDHHAAASSSSSQDECRHAVQRVLAAHVRLKEMDIQVFGASPALTGSIVALARGLQQNTSVLSISWTLYWSPRRGLDGEAVQALADLMKYNTTARFLFVRRESAGWDNTATKMPHDNLEEALFDSLLYTSVDTFRFNCHIPVKDSNKKKAWHAMKENPRLRRIKATFENHDYQLELLRKDKKYQWSQKWLGTDNNSSQPQKDCWNVLQEAVALCDDDMDPVFVIYHFLRDRPELVV
ncbi:expressed unknown protein [Seminavis robusta]|uniref:ZZ-type domain-containing protein n=1 Tax=Seminavis robusta TaxID=568900 RepID=A0A9N8DC98_9STRA|nr:expressed unknown protein [Seminavis robusta]|eukprot:Sro32_g020740.1 n/a (400) ;mRNA; r:49053-50252